MNREQVDNCPKNNSFLCKDEKYYIFNTHAHKLICNFKKNKDVQHMNTFDFYTFLLFHLHCRTQVNHI